MMNQLKRPNRPCPPKCDLNSVRSAFSEPRMYKYINAVRKDNQHIDNAMRLYKINMLYCEALYPCLHSLEIVLRNSIDSSLCKHYDKYWLIPEKSCLNQEKIRNFEQNHQVNIIFPENSTNILLEKEQEKVFAAIKKIITSKGINGDFDLNKAREKIISKLTLGFWVSLLTKNKVSNQHYFNKIFLPCIKNILPHAKNRERTKSSIEHLTDIQKLRNRVFHHEPIWQYENLEQRYNYINKVIRMGEF